MKFILISVLSICSSLNEKHFLNIIDDLVVFDEQQTEMHFNKSFPESSRQFTIFGWYQHNGEMPAISNLFSVRTMIPLKDEATVNFNLDSSKEPCKYAAFQTHLDPSLLLDKNVLENPNCFPRIEIMNYEQIGDSLVFLNYELSEDRSTFSLSLLVKQGTDENKKPLMIFDSFEGNNFKENEWIYFAISVDYEKKEVIFLMEIYDLENPHQKSKQILLHENNLGLSKHFSFTVNRTGDNDFFDNSQKILGNIFRLAIANFTDSNLNYFSLAAMCEQKLLRNGILMDLIANVHTEQEPLKSQGLIIGEYPVTGKHELLFLENKEKVGVKIFEGPLSGVNLKTVEIPPSLQLELAFYLRFSYVEELREHYNLVQIGKAGQSGFLDLKLTMVNQSRYLHFKIIGTGDILVWQSPFEILPNMMIEIQIGFVISPAKTFQLVYSDSQNNHHVESLSNRFFFEMNKNSVHLFQNEKGEGTGHIEFQRFLMLDSVSKIVTKIMKNETKTCLERFSSYKSSSCFSCRDSIADTQYRCLEFCPINYKNAHTNVCLPCLKPNCQEFPKTKLIISQEDDDTFILTGTKVLSQNFSEKMKNLFEVKIDELDFSSGLFSYKSYEMTDQKLGFDFIFNKDMRNSFLRIKPKGQHLVNVFDVNRNLVDPEIARISLQSVCFVGHSKQVLLDFLFYFNLVLLVFAFLTLLCLSFTKLEFNRWYFWKFLLQIYMKCQLVAFLTLMSLMLPCCVYNYMDKFYNVFVQWNYVLRGTLDGTYGKSEVYREVLISKSPERRQFLLEGVRPFVLHNNGIFFIIQMTAFSLWAINLIVLRLSKKEKVKLIAEKINMAFLYTVFGIIMMLSFFPNLTFASINLRQMQFNHFYFIVCFLISICYFLAFLFYYFASLIQTHTTKSLSKKITSQFYIFLVTYRKDRFSQKWDLIQHFLYALIAFVIGFVYESLIAQSLLISFALLITIILLQLIKPFVDTIHLRMEIVSFTLLFFSYIFIMIISINEEIGCIYCGDREGALCFLIVIPIFVSILISLTFFFYLLIMDIKVGRVSNKVQFHNPFEKISVQKLKAKIQNEKLPQQNKGHPIPNTPRQDTETQGSIIFTDRNEVEKEIQQLRLKQESMEQYLKTAQEKQEQIETLQSNDLESEVFNEEKHDLNESIEFQMDMESGKND